VTREETRPLIGVFSVHRCLCLPYL
jgi:hypothetical protein